MKKRDETLDFLRVIAAFTVVWLHVSGGVVVSNPSVSDLHWWTGNVADSFARWCVPVFIMISGALLLSGPPSPLDLEYYRRRLPRVLIPLFFWTIFYLIWRFLKGDDVGLRNVIGAFVHKGSYYHLWYLYMIIGLYLITPFLQKLIAVTSPRAITVLCGFMLIAAAVETAAGAQSATVLYAGAHNATFLYEFIPYLGFFLAGYCLYRETVGVDRRLLVLLFVFCGGIVAVWTGASLSIKPQPWNYTYSYLNPIVIIMSLSLFALVAGNLTLSPPADRFIRSTAPLTLGIYVMHPAWLDVLQHYGLDGFSLHPLIGIPATTLVTFILSVLSTSCFLALPGLRRAVA